MRCTKKVIAVIVGSEFLILLVIVALVVASWAFIVLLCELDPADLSGRQVVVGANGVDGEAR